MAGIKELKTRIKSIGGMRKVTRAMQMVSAAKMRKAQAATLASRTYSSLAWELISDLVKGVDYNSSLLANYNEAKKVGVILLSSNRGLVGSLNTNLVPKLKQVDAESGAETIAEVVTYGKHAKNIAVRLQKNIVADFPKLEKTLTTQDILPLVEFVKQAYATGQYKKIVIVYNHFVSTLTQTATIKQLLPFKESENTFYKEPRDEEESEDGEKSEGEEVTIDSPFLFEPDPKEVLNQLLPRILESQIYQTILESNASEHSARMVMMKNATEAAGDLISDLTLTYNQLRQGKITTELAEITAGRIALE